MISTSPKPLEDVHTRTLCVCGGGCGAGDWTQGFVHGRQALHPLSCIPSHFPPRCGWRLEQLISSSWCCFSISAAADHPEVRSVFKQHQLAILQLCGLEAREGPR